MHITVFVWYVRWGSNPDRRRRRALWYPIPPRAHLYVYSIFIHLFTEQRYKFIGWVGFRVGFFTRLQINHNIHSNQNTQKHKILCSVVDTLVPSEACALSS